MGDKVPAVWCVQSKYGWCACQEDREPKEGSNNVPTLCGYFVVLPWGYEQRVPTCPECLLKFEGVTP